MGFIAYLLGEQPGLIESLINYKDKGQYGEYLAEYALNHNNLKGYLITLKNLYIPYKGKTTEIDLLMIHEKGIFVFESKNYGGWIFGGADQQKWTQMLNRHEKNQFYNPILQNKTHIHAISAYLNLPCEAFLSYIVFSERCELKQIPDDTDSFTILRRHHLLKNLRTVLDARPIRYTHEEVDALAEKLKALGNADEKEKQQHIENIKESLSGTKCPFCGAELVKHHGKHGDFYGCSNYPKCRFTRKSQD